MAANIGLRIAIKSYVTVHIADRFAAKGQMQGSTHLSYIDDLDLLRRSIDPPGNRKACDGGYFKCSG
ncbi:MAG: hypothetical protein P1U89_21890 [Verrucomicrobiales bacterium]|nr:hypothetical protein [Verrucomicrobiales bacterium]